MDMFSRLRRRKQITLEIIHSVEALGESFRTTWDDDTKTSKLISWIFKRIKKFKMLLKHCFLKSAV